ncbi:MAG TPA: polysaccharide lyase family 8 super-sandwich domain-containing protein [Thermoanaerobaculia bacterium]|nr:polysaccharide lyase family 8 super-sandwich domain-containing protein [Thermoanaerobaculia bacterium]
MKKLLTIFFVVAASSASAADIDVVRQQFIAYSTAGNSDRSSQRMVDALAALEAQTRDITAPGFLRDDGSWSDIDYITAPSGDWGPWSHSRRMIVMARAYQTPGQSFYRHPQLLTQLNAVLAYTKVFYGATKPPVGNWWFWTMGIPLDLGPTLVLMRNDVDPATYNELVSAMALRIGNSPTAKGIVGPTPTGENLVWSSFTHLCLALARDDPAMLDAVRNAMASVTRVTTGEGIKKDRSFHQHGAQLYTGGYGGSFANDVAKYALITRNTTYGLPSDSLASFADYVADGIAWSLYHMYFDVSVISREVARPSTSGFHGMAALLQAAQFPSARQAEIRAAAAKMMQTWRGTMNTELAGLAAQVESARYPAAWPSGHRHYFASDYTIHRRNGWFASVKMFSNRTKSGEDTNDENVRGARQSDGRFYLVLRGDEYFGRDIWPAFDWSRLPGITVEQKADTAGDLYGYGTKSFAGGTGDGQNGVSAMELAPLGSLLAAKKAWFFFDDAIVFLTNSILSPGGNRVETIVNQWPLVNANSQLVRNGDWAYLENVGYWFPTPVDLQTSRETRSGSWAALGGSADTTEVSKPIVTMWLDHGVNPTGASAEYVIVPNVTQSQMASWAASRPLSILANNDTLSAVRDIRNGNLGITFWRAGAIDGISSSAAAVVYVTQNTTARTLAISAADPNAAVSGTFTITLPGAWYSDTVPVTRTSRGTVLTFAKNGGQTTTVTLKAGLAKKRAVR